MNDMSPPADPPTRCSRRTLRDSGRTRRAADWSGPESLAALEDVASRYAVAITPAMVELIDPADTADPIARQFVPDAGRTGHPARGARRSDRRWRP